MSKNMQNLVVFMEPSEYEWNTSLKAGNMILNRFCIDENAAFELSGVHYLTRSGYRGKKKKVIYDEEVINSALQNISENDAKELIYDVEDTYIPNRKLYAVKEGWYYYFNEDKLRSIILKNSKGKEYLFVRSYFILTTLNSHESIDQLIILPKRTL